MPPRLAHKKSKKGCLQCKTRKVKCDESTPTCRSCQRHGVVCTYPQPIEPSNANFSNRATTFSDLASPNLPQTNYDRKGPADNVGCHLMETEERRLLELRLLHHFLTVVEPTLSGQYDTEIRKAWTVRVPVMAIQHPFLLNAVLATAALHLAVQLPQSCDTSAPQSGHTPDFSDVHRTYLNLAVQQQSQAISQLCPDTADAICMATVLISHHGFLLGRHSSDEEYSPPIQWLQLGTATPTVIQSSMPMLPQDAAIGFLIKGSDYASGLVSMHKHESLEPYTHLLNWSEHPEPEFNEDVRTAYEVILSFVSSINTAIKEQEPPATLSRRFLAFGSLAPIEYIDLLWKRRPRALIILAHLFAMTKVVGHIWWFCGAAEKNVYGIQKIIPRDWQWALEWPLEYISSSSNDS